MSSDAELGCKHKIVIVLLEQIKAPADKYRSLYVYLFQFDAESSFYDFVLFAENRVRDGMREKSNVRIRNHVPRIFNTFISTLYQFTMRKNMQLFQSRYLK